MRTLHKSALCMAAGLFFSSVFVIAVLATAEPECDIAGLAETLLDADIDDSTLVFHDHRVDAAMALAACGTQAIDSLINALNSNQPATRLLAAWALGTSKNAQAVEALTKCLTDVNAAVRWKAAVSLARIGMPAVESLVNELSSDKASVRESAAWALGIIGQSKSEYFDNALAAEPRPSAFRRFVYQIFGRFFTDKKISDNRAVNSLTALANDPEQEVRSAVAIALGRIGDEASLPVLISMLHDKDDRVARQAAWAATQFSAQAAALLADLIKNKSVNASVCSHAVQALSEIGEPEVLIPTLTAPEITTRRYGAEALWRMQSEDQRAVEPLVAALTEDDVKLRAYAAGALGWSDDVRAVKPLISALNDSEPFVRSMAVDALRHLANPEAVPALAALMEKEPEEMRRKIVAALGAMGKDALQPLADALRDADPVTRTSAVLLLGQTGDDRAIDPLRQAMDAVQNDMPTDWAGFFNVLRAFPKAFGYMQGNPRAVEALLELLARGNNQAGEYRWGDTQLLYNVNSALESVTGQRPPPLFGGANLKWWRKWWADADGEMPEAAQATFAECMETGLSLYERTSGSAYIRSKIDFEASCADFQRALGLARTDNEKAEALLALAENRLNDPHDRSYQDIRDLFEQLLHMRDISESDRFRALLGIGQTWLREDEYTIAHGFFQQATEAAPGADQQNMAVLQSAIAYIQEMRYDDARIILEKLVQSNPDARRGTAWEARALLEALRQAPLMRPDRPRMFFDSVSWPQIKNRALTVEKDRYEAMRERVENLSMQRIVAQPDDWGMQAMESAFVYRVSGDPAILEKTEALLRSTITAYLTDDVPRGRSYSAIACLAALDWAWNDLTPPDRIELADDMLDYVYTLLVEDMIQDENRAGHLSYYIKSVFWFAGVALLEPELDDAARVRALQTLGAGIVGQRFPDNPGKPDGAVDRRPEYYFNAVPDMIWPYFYIYESALGRSVPADWIHIMTPDYILRSILPMPAESGTGRIHHFNFSNSWKHRAGMQCVNLHDHIGRLIHFFGESHPQQAAIARTVRERLENNQMTGIEPRSLFPVYPFLVALEKAPPPAIPENMPIARHFEYNNQILMSSGFGADDTYAAFICKGSSKDFDGTHFTIFRNGYLALDSGTRAQGNWYYRASIAHNLVLISMSPETLEKHDDWPLNLKTGGQINPYAVELTAFESTPYYAYMATDATRAYHEDACALMTRQFVFLPPEHFVVFDRVTSTKAEYPKTWLLHTANEPHVIAKEFFADQGMGRIFCRTLLPDDAVLEPVGGPGREFWAAGSNWPIPENSSYFKQIGMEGPSGEIPETIGRWRVEVKPGADREQDFFLHLIRTTDQNVAMMGESEVLENDEYVGVRFNSGARNFRVEFNRVGVLGGKIKIEEDDQTLVDGKLTQEVMPQTGLALRSDESSCRKK